MKSGNFMVFGLKVSRCHLCFAVAWDSGFDVFPPEYYQHVLKCLTVNRVYVPESLQGPFPEQRVKLVNFHLLCLDRLHFDHCVEQVLEKLKLFAFPSNVIGVVWTGRMIIV